MTEAVTIPDVNRTSFFWRLVGAAGLRAAIYEEVEADPHATVQAIAVVVLASVAGGVGFGGWSSAAPAPLIAFAGLALGAWGIWAFLTYQIGTRILPESRTRADVGQLLRTLGFSAAPGLLSVLAVIPGLGMPVFAMTASWMLLTMIVAIRQALDYRSTGRAIAVCVLGWVLTFGLLLAFGFFFGPRLS